MRNPTGMAAITSVASGTRFSRRRKLSILGAAYEPAGLFTAHVLH